MLKRIQEHLASALREHQQAIRTEKGIKANISHAFESNKSIITNARIHRNKYLILNLDLEHFFETFHFGRVSGFFEKNRDFLLPHEVATVIAQITCYKGHLPQGAPSSPIITNLICQILDMHILKMAQAYKLDYTRYADDMTFSTNDRSFVEKKEIFIQELEKEINKAGFLINHQKTRMCLRDSRQMVTGLIVNKKLNVSAEYYRKTRAMAFNLYAHGSFEINGHQGTITQLEGRFSFIDQLDHYNNKLDGKKHDNYNLNGREQQYRAFLFYKHFYANEKPLIVTEGKTDILYIKAALRKLCDKYPELVSKVGEGKFRYNVGFLHKTNKLAYFLGIAPDGANTMKNIYNYYGEKRTNGFPNYYAKFSKIRQVSSQQPVILLLDNEMSSGKRPLSDFLKHIKANDEAEETLKEKLFLKLGKETNLYLLTNPLVEGKTECEIEMLFDSETRALKLGDKSLCLKDKYETEKYYGKDIFSKYIAQHYEEIDFRGFEPLLDTLSVIVMQRNSGES